MTAPHRQPLMVGTLFLAVTVGISIWPGPLAAAAGEAGERLLILTMESKDIRNPRGHPRFVANALRPVPEFRSPPDPVIGVFPKDEETFQLFVVLRQQDGARMLGRCETSDFVKYTKPEVVF